MIDVRDQAIKIIQQMPENVSFDDIMAKLYFCHQVEKGLKQLDEGKGIDHEEIERRMAEWLKE